MKKVILIWLLLCGFISSAQTITEKYNSLYNQYEYYNSSGQQVGYKKYNSLYNTWEYYDTQPKAQTIQYSAPKPSFNADLTYKVLAYKQSQYDNNVNSVQNAINTISDEIVVMSLPSSVYDNVNERFTKECVNKLNGKKYDMSNVSTTNQIINWLYDCVNKIVKQEIDDYNANLSLEKTRIEISLINLFGGYSVGKIVEANYDAQTKSYIDTKTDTSGAKLYFSKGSLGFFKNSNNAWKFNSLMLILNEPDYFVFADNYGQHILIEKNFRFVTFYDEMRNGTHQKSYTYSLIKKDPTIKQPF